MDTGLYFNYGLVLAGLFTGFLLGYLYFHQKITARNTELRLVQAALQEKYQHTQTLASQIKDSQHLAQALHIELGSARQQLNELAELKSQHQHLAQELRQQLDINRLQESELRVTLARHEESQLAAEEKQRLLINSEQRLSIQFENLANRIFSNNHLQLDKHNQTSLQSLLAPLREQLEGFRRQVNESFSQEARERHTLSHEISELQKLNSRMAEEAINLTRALKGDNKIQGNWGEVVLAKVLEASGLRAGHEYETQVSIQSEQRRFQPDVIVRLPHKKVVIIDAKVTLTAYERYYNAEDKAIQQQALHGHIHAIKQHIKGLGQKDYHKLPGLRSLDYVLLFIPIEPAFLLAIEQQPELINEALQHNVMLVSPTTLLVALRTISNLWRYEQQTQNAQKIAERASRLYDKMRLFVDDMQSVGVFLDKACASHQQAMKKLSRGRGNLIAQSEAFRHLGVEIKRPISPDLAQIATEENADIVSDLAQEFGVDATLNS